MSINWLDKLKCVIFTHFLVQIRMVLTFLYDLFHSNKAYYGNPIIKSSEIKLLQATCSIYKQVITPSIVFYTTETPCGNGFHLIKNAVECCGHK